MQLDTQTIWSRVQSALAWPPDWLVGVVILLAAALLALLVHWLAIGIARRVVGTRRVFLDSLMVRTSAPTRLALVVFALSAALPAAPFEPAVRETIAHALLVVFILLVGWFAMIAVHLAAAVYLRRFHVESEDN